MSVSKNSGTPKWMVKIMENPIKMDDLGVPLFLEIPRYSSIDLDYVSFLPPKTHLRECITETTEITEALPEFQTLNFSIEDLGNVVAGKMAFNMQVGVVTSYKIIRVMCFFFYGGRELYNYQKNMMLTNKKQRMMMMMMMMMMISNDSMEWYGMIPIVKSHSSHFVRSQKLSEQNDHTKEAIYTWLSTCPVEKKWVPQGDTHLLGPAATSTKMLNHEKIK